MRLAALLLFLWPAILSAGAPLLYIDPGHGGEQKGVQGGALNEAEIVQDIAVQLQAQLKAKGMETALSRTGFQNPAPSARVAAANASGARAFLSLHVNHSPTATVRGPRVFIPKALPSTPGEPRRWSSAAGQRSDEARALALEVAKALSQSESARVNVQALNLVNFKGLAIPGLVAELGFLSHAESRARFADPEYRKAVAGRLADGILAWAGAIGLAP